LDIEYKSGIILSEGWPSFWPNAVEDPVVIFRIILFLSLTHLLSANAFTVSAGGR
jgi:hypothetical protein